MVKPLRFFERYEGYCAFIATAIGRIKTFNYLAKISTYVAAGLKLSEGK
jgi:hypothetical protein